MNEIKINKMFNIPVVKLDKNYAKDICFSVADNLKSQSDDYLMSFLKSKGYRPKPTIKYLKSLQQRLKSKGLQLKYYQSIDYGIPEETKDGIIYKGLFKQLLFIDSIDNPTANEIDIQKTLDKWEGNIYE